MQVAGLLLRQWLEGSGGQERLLGIHPLTQAVERLKPQAILMAALRALQAASQVRYKIFLCLPSLCYLHCNMSGIDAVHQHLGAHIHTAR